MAFQWRRFQFFDKVSAAAAAATEEEEEGRVGFVVDAVEQSRAVGGRRARVCRCSLVSHSFSPCVCVCCCCLLLFLVCAGAAVGWVGESRGLHAPAGLAALPGRQRMRESEERHGVGGVNDCSRLLILDLFVRSFPFLPPSPPDSLRLGRTATLPPAAPAVAATSSSATPRAWSKSSTATWKNRNSKLTSHT